MIIVIPLTTWSSNGKPRGTLRLTETESPIGIQLSYQTAIWGPCTSQATPTSFQWQPKTYYTMLQQRRPTWTKRKKFYNLLNTHTSDNIKCHDIHLVGGQFNTKLAQDSHTEASRAVGPCLLNDTTNNNGERRFTFNLATSLRHAQSRFPRPGCTQQIHTLTRNLQGFQAKQLP